MKPKARGVEFGGSKRPTSNAGIRSQDPQTGSSCVSYRAQGVHRNLLHPLHSVLRHFGSPIMRFSVVRDNCIDSTWQRR